MNKKIDAQIFGLPRTTVVIEETGNNILAIFIDRQSRIIRKDGQKIIVKAEKIKAHQPGCRVVLKTTAPVCSKTMQLLKEHCIDVYPVA